MGSSRQVRLVCNEPSGTKVSADTHVLDNGRKTDERLDVGVWERVLARLGGGVAQGCGEESDVRCLVLGNLGKPVPDPARVAGSFKGVSVELGKSVGVEVAERVEALVKLFVTSKIRGTHFSRCSNVKA